MKFFKDMSYLKNNLRTTKKTGPLAIIFSISCLWVLASNFTSTSTFLLFLCASFANLYVIYLVLSQTKTELAATEKAVGKEADQAMGETLTAEEVVEITTDVKKFEKLLTYAGNAAQFLLLSSKNQLELQKNINVSNVETTSLFRLVETKLAAADVASTNVRVQAEQGLQAMNRMSDCIATLTTVSKSVESFCQALTLIAANFQGIDEIARATHFISFNASIEAERAGEHGRTFAVVANEIRDLSNKTTVLSKKIKVDLDASLAKVSTMSAEINGAVALSVKSIHQSKTDLDGFFRDVGGAFDDICEASQSFGKYAELAKNVSESLEKITHVANALETSAASVKLIQLFLEDYVRENNQQLLAKTDIESLPMPDGDENININKDENKNERFKEVA